MRVHEQPISHIDGARHLNFVSVQLKAPVEDRDWDFDKNEKTWVWRPNPRTKRIKEVKDLVNFLLSSRSPRKPDVIVFPEYCVPREAHVQIDFQRLAVENNCILIPGSYFEDDDARALLHSKGERPPQAFRQNICHIYLPDSNIITIGKIHEAPGEKGLLPATGLPNIARLIWHPPGQQPVSISIFLCRDYLTPFCEETEPPTENANTIKKSRRISLLDWEREGINVVVMNNTKSELFQGAAGGDIRDLHGKRKAVLLSNAGQEGSDLGTALLVASPTRERADVAISILPKIEGMLFAEVRLWQVKAVKEQPDTKETFPVDYVASYSIDSTDPLDVSPVTSERAPSLYRGVWHPAFLEQRQLNIVLDFFVAKSTLVPISEAFDTYRIRHVKAAFVRGVQDLMIRRYTPKYLQENGSVPLSLPFSYIKDEEFDEVFDHKHFVPDLQVIIYPAKLLKYRGKQVPLKEWDRTLASINRIALRSDHALVESACALAREAELDDDGELRASKDLKTIFSLGLEQCPPAEAESRGEREYYVLVRAQRSTRDGAPSDEFRKQIVLSYLLGHDRVMEISEIVSHPPQFNYCIQMTATSGEVDEVLLSMHGWAHSNAIAFGTRTYELGRTLRRDAVSGIQYIDMEEFERDFLGQAKKLAGDIQAATWDNEQRRTIAVVWDKGRDELAPLGDCRDDISAFFVYVALYNFQRAGAESDYLDGAGRAWIDLFQRLEQLSEQILVDVLCLRPSASIEEIAKAIEAKFPDKVKKNVEWYKIRTSSYRMVVGFYNDVVGTKDRLAAFRRGAYQSAEIRNLLAHPRKDEFAAFVTFAGQNWLEKFREIGAKSALLCGALVDIDQELKIRARNKPAR